MPTLPDARESVLDRAWWTYGESHPSTPMDIGVIIHLSGAPPRLEDLRLLIGASLDRLPVLTHRLVGKGMRSRWEPDPGFRLDRHVLEVIADEPGRDGALSTAQRLLSRPLTADVPWQLWLVRSSAQDSYCLYYRVHHAWQDGVACAQTFLAVFSPTAVAEQCPGRAAGRRLSRAMRGAALAARLVGEVLMPVRSNPAYGRQLSGERRVATACVPLHRLSAVARACGATVNEVYLAALAGAIRAWSTEVAVEPVPVPVLMPLNLRNPGELPGWGNRFIGRRVWLPCDEAEPLRRLDRTVLATEGAKSASDRQAARDLLATVPAGVVRLALRCLMSSRYAPVIASHVPMGGGGVVTSTGVTDMAPLTLLPFGHPFNACLVTFGDTAQIAVVSDVAVPSADRLALLWREAVDELTVSATDRQRGRPIEPDGAVAPPAHQA